MKDKRERSLKKEEKSERREERKAEKKEEGKLWSIFGEEWKRQIHSDRRRLAWHVFCQYMLAMTIYTVVMLAVNAGIYFGAKWYCNLYIWYPEEVLYWILKILQYAGPVLAGIFYLILAAGITYHYIAKPLNCLSDVVQAAEKLSQLTEEPVLLPRELKSVQDQMNYVREQARHNALIAKESEQRKNDLIVYLAHDLKTPLTSVIGYLTLLRDEPQISPQLREKYTDIALSKSERLEELINDFFDITRFNLTQLSIETQRVNLTLMLEQIAYEFRPALDQKKMSIEIDYEKQIEILCDPGKLERVFDNLYRNALNYGYEGTVIKTTIKEEEPWVSVTIRNCGKTIPPEKLNRVFEQFFRLDSSRTSVTGGAGLGLAIAREIIELHHGTIAASSAQESIEFLVKLPM